MAWRTPTVPTPLGAKPLQESYRQEGNLQQLLGEPTPDIVWHPSVILAVAQTYYWYEDFYGSGNY